MERKKHLLAFIGLSIATTVFAILTYLAWIESWPVTLEYYPYVILVLWIFVMIITVGFAAAYPRNKIEEETRVEDKKENDGKPVDFEPIEEEKELNEETIFKEVPVKALKKCQSFEEVPELVEDPPTEEIVTGVFSRINTEIEKNLLPVDWAEIKDKPFKILLFDLPHTIKLMRKLGFDIEGVNSQYWLKVYPDVEEEEKKENFVPDLKIHIDEIKKEREVDEKIERGKFNDKVNTLLESVEKPELQVDDPPSERQKVHKYLRDHPKTTRDELAKEFSLSNGVAGTYLNRWGKSLDGQKAREELE